MVAPGDKVVLTPIAPCGRCYWCQRDQPGCCVNNAAVLGGAFLDGSTGLSRGGEQVFRGLGVGGFAEYAMTSETGAVKVPDDTPLETACVIGCAVQTGVGAVLNTAKVEPGATVLVLGLGGIGLSVVQGARAAGAAQIIASDPLDWRRDAAASMGATTVLDPNADDVLAATRDLTSVGADYAFECAGVAALAARRHRSDAGRRFHGARGCAAARGQARARPARAVRASARRSSWAASSAAATRCATSRGMVAMWRAGQLDLDALVTARRPLDEINDAFDDLAAGVGIRTVIDLV